MRPVPHNPSGARVSCVPKRRFFTSFFGSSYCLVFAHWHSIVRHCHAQTFFFRAKRRFYQPYISCSNMKLVLPIFRHIFCQKKKKCADSFAHQSSSSTSRGKSGEQRGPAAVHRNWWSPDCPLISWFLFCVPFVPPKPNPKAKETSCATTILLAKKKGALTIPVIKQLKEVIQPISPSSSTLLLAAAAVVISEQQDKRAASHEPVPFPASLAQEAHCSLPRHRHISLGPSAPTVTLMA